MVRARDIPENNLEVGHIEGYSIRGEERRVSRDVESHKDAWLSVCVKTD